MTGQQLIHPERLTAKGTWTRQRMPPRTLGFDKHEIAASTYDVLVNDHPLRQIVQLSKRVRLYLAPSSLQLAGAEIELVEMPDREKRLRHALADLLPNYDYILIDCPPSLGLLTVNGLVAAEDGILVPVQCEYLATWRVSAS